MLVRGLRSGCTRGLSHCSGGGIEGYRRRLITFSIIPPPSNNNTNIFQLLPALSHAPFHSGLRTMASLVTEKHEWTAVRVRDTFLDYFKKNGHTFGGSSHCEML